MLDKRDDVWYNKHINIEGDYAMNNMTQRLNILLDDIQTHGVVRYQNTPPQQIDNATIADFLMLNQVMAPPARVGSKLTSKNGQIYIVTGYSYSNKNGHISENIDLMKISETGNTLSMETIDGNTFMEMFPGSV